MKGLDTVIGQIAPHQCISCGVEGSVMCRSCVAVAGEPIIPRCAGCRALSAGSKTCKSCRPWLHAYAIFVATNYEGIYEQLIREFKFNYKSQAAEPVAIMMGSVVTELPLDTVVCPLPTAPSRIRQRGFDHTRLLAHEFVRRNRSFSKSVLLGRHTNVRQLGASRSQRLQQMEEEFYVKDPSRVAGKTILLLDDVMTTGASVAAATNKLKKAGAKRVYVVVFAQKV